MAEALRNAVTEFVNGCPHPAEAWDDAAALTSIGIDIAQTLRMAVRSIDRRGNCTVMARNGMGELRVTAGELVDHICDGMAGSIRGEEVIRASAMNELDGGTGFFVSDDRRERAAA